MEKPTSALVIGHLTLDTICDRHNRTAHFDVPQGAALGAASAAAIWGAKVTVVSVIGADYPPTPLKKMARNGIRIHSVGDDTDSLRFWILRESKNVVTQLPHVGTTIERATPQASAYRSFVTEGEFDLAHLCPMPLAEQIAWAEALREFVPVISVDPQPFTYAPVGSKPERDFRRLLQATTILSITPDRYPTARTPTRFPHLWGPPPDVLSEVLTMGPKVVTLKLGSEGSMIGLGDLPLMYQFSALPVSVADPTGAGDAYAGSFAVSFKETGDAAKSGIRATATAAVMIERVGMTHILDERPRIAALAHGYRLSDVTQRRRPK